MLLNTEIAIKKREVEAKGVGDFAIHHNVIAQSDFAYLTAAQKLMRVQNYKDLKRELQKTREMRTLLQSVDASTQADMTASYDSLLALLK